jgi:hypothetical protein
VPWLRALFSTGETLGRQIAPISALAKLTLLFIED